MWEWETWRGAASYTSETFAEHVIADSSPLMAGQIADTADHK